MKLRSFHNSFLLYFMVKFASCIVLVDVYQGRAGWLFFFSVFMYVLAACLGCEQVANVGGRCPTGDGLLFWY